MGNEDSLKWMVVVRYAPNNDKTMEVFAESAQEAVLKSLDSISDQIQIDTKIEQVELWVHGLNNDVPNNHELLNLNVPLQEALNHSEEDITSGFEKPR